MRHVFRNSAECAHVWASRSQDDGRAGNVTFKNDSIYSYGWWEMARFIEVKGQTIVLMRNWSYSSETSKHMNYVHGALRGLSYEIVYCHGEPKSTYSWYGRGGGNLLNHKESIKYWLDRMRDSHQKLKRAKYPDWQVNQNHSARKSIIDYCLLFDLELPKEMIDFYLDPDDIAPLLAAKEKRAKELEAGADERAAKRKESLIKKNQEKVDEFLINEVRWMNGENVPTTFRLNSSGRYRWHSSNNIEFSQTRLRIKNETVETSRQAYVPVKDAKLLWALIKNGRDIKGHNIGGYTVISMNGVLKIGCHEIKREEMERFVEKYNW